MYKPNIKKWGKIRATRIGWTDFVSLALCLIFCSEILTKREFILIEFDFVWVSSKIGQVEFFVPCFFYPVLCPTLEFQFTSAVLNFRQPPNRSVNVQSLQSLNFRTESPLYWSLKSAESPSYRGIHPRSSTFESKPSFL